MRGIEPRSRVTHGLVLGKFLPYHAGHAHLIRSARARVDRLTVLVCSIAREPIPGGVRFQWVRRAHPDCDVVWVNEEVPQSPEETPAFWPIWADLVARHAGRVDILFTSEDYGDELAARIGAGHACIDPARRSFPVSGTAVRADPLLHWDFLPVEVRPFFVRRVALVGAESTGKTTLSELLAREHDTVWVPEYGRRYCEEGRDALELTLADFEAIAWGQAVSEDEAASRANRLLLCDTELHTTVTWSEIVTGARPPLAAAAARARRYDLVVLLDHDLPWVDDGTRVLSLQRVEHTRRLRRELDAAQQPYVVVGGRHAERLRAVSALIGDRVLKATNVPAQAIAFPPAM